MNPRAQHLEARLKSHPVRSLQESSLTGAAGGWTIYTEATSCTPTVQYTCHPKTPNCPI